MKIIINQKIARVSHGVIILVKKRECFQNIKIFDMPEKTLRRGLYAKKKAGFIS
jgi:hypothetical protein